MIRKIKGARFFIVAALFYVFLLGVLIAKMSETTSSMSEIWLDSSSPQQSSLGHKVSLNLKGNGFSKGVKAALVFDGDDRKAIVGSIDTDAVIGQVVVVGNYAYLASYRRGLQVADVSNPQSPAVVAARLGTGGAYDVAVEGHIGYVAARGGGVQIDEVGGGDVEGLSTVYSAKTVMGVAVNNHVLYAIDYQQGLFVADVRNPESPIRIAHLDLGQGGLKIAYKNGRIYVANKNGKLQIVDVRNPHRPKLLYDLSLPGRAFEVKVKGGYAYVADGRSGLQVVDVRGGRPPKIVASLPATDQFLGLCVKGARAYLADSHGGLDIVDISSPESPKKIGLVDTSGSIVGVAVSGNFAYLAAGDAGFQVADLRLIKKRPFYGSVDIPERTGGVLVSGAIAYVTDLKRGLLTVDIRDPRQPKIIGVSSAGLSLNSKGTLLLQGHHLFVFDYTSGLCIFDVSDPARPRVVGRYAPSSSVWGGAVRGRFAYLALGKGQVVVLDLSNIGSPNVVGELNMPGGARGIALQDNWAYVAAEKAGLQIIDISSPGKMKIVASVKPGWPTDEFATATGVALVGHYAYLSDGQNGLQVVDVADPKNPLRISNLDLGDYARGISAAGSNLYIQTGKKGIVAVDASQPESPQILATFGIPYQSHNTMDIIGKKFFMTHKGGRLVIVPLPVEATRVVVKDAKTLEVTFPPLQLKGDYSVQLYDGNQRAVLDDALSVTSENEARN